MNKIEKLVVDVAMSSGRFQSIGFFYLMLLALETHKKGITAKQYIEEVIK